MTDELDFEGAFQGLSPDQSRELMDRVRSSVREAVTSYKNPKPPEPQVDPLDEQEAAEMEALRQSGIRGQQFAIYKLNISKKYAADRAANVPPPVDEEIEKVANDPKALKQLYLARLATIKRGDPVALHKKNEIASAFRAKGLNV